MYIALPAVLCALVLSSGVLASPAPTAGIRSVRRAKRACVRPSHSASATASASTITSSSSIVESASASAPASNVLVGQPSISASVSTAEPLTTSSALSLADSTSTSTSSATASATQESKSSDIPSSSASSAAAAAPTTGNANADLLVNLHNDFRKQYGAGPVTWNDDLAKFATDYAPICQMKHSGGPYGENLAGGAGGGYNVTSAFNSWAEEGQYYDWSKPGTLQATVDGNSVGLGHFTQVVWKATTEIGCAVVSCDTLFEGFKGAVFVVCEYSPAGNVYMSGNDPNQFFVQNVGEKI